MQLPKERRRWLLLPCLNKVREFDGKLLFSAMAVESGWGVMLGYKGFVNLVETPGAVIEMSFKSGNLDRHERLGRKICAWDEEGLVFTSPHDYCRRRLLDSSIDRMEMGFLWGKNQQGVIRGCKKESKAKFHVTGNPRFDMLRPELREYYAPESERLIRQYGDFILVNSNFATVNEYRGRAFTMGKLRVKQVITTAEDEQNELARERFEEAIMAAFIQAIPRLSSEFREFVIIVRPHPSEDFEVWREKTAGLPNVRVVHQGDVIPWLMAARAAIHNSCTTGIQSYLLGKPAVAYLPARSVEYDKDLPNSLSIHAESLDELMAAIKRLLAGSHAFDSPRLHEMEGIAAHHIEGLSGPWASQRVLDQLGNLEVEEETLKLSPSYVTGMDRRSAGGAMKLARLGANILRRGMPVQKPDLESAPEVVEKEKYVRQTFPKLDIGKVRADLARLAQITGRFRKVSVFQTGDDHICLFPTEA